MTDELKALITNPSHDDVAETVETQEEVTESTEETVEEVAQPSESDILRQELETYKQRFKDTQKFAQKAHQENLRRLNDDKEAGLLSDEEYNEKLANIKSNDLAMADNPITEIAKQFDAEKELVIGVMGLDTDKAEAAIQAFNRTMALDPNLQEKLLNIPAQQRTKWILEQGMQMGESVNLIDEHGGILGAINHLKASKPDMEALREEIRKEVLEELKHKTKPNLGDLGKSVSKGVSTPTGSAYLKSLLK